jgi:uncharacterized protein (TIGR02284 family)
MDNEKTIAVLNSLIIINNDRIEGYETAASETTAQDLKDLFAVFQTTSKHCKAALITEVYKLKGLPDEGTRTTGKFFRVWMEVKAFLTGNDRVSILNSCEFGEEAIQKAYTEVLSEDLENISIEQQTMLNEQCKSLLADLTEIRSLRDSFEKEVK